MIVVSEIAFEIDEEAVERFSGKQTGMKGGNVIFVRRVCELDGGIVRSQCETGKPRFSDLPIYAECQAVGGEFQIIGSCRVPLRPVAESAKPHAVLFGIAVYRLSECRGEGQEQGCDDDKGTHKNLIIQGSQPTAGRLVGDSRQAYRRRVRCSSAEYRTSRPAVD